MAKERKELIVLDGLTILFIVMLIVNGVTLALLYRWHNMQIFAENVKNQKIYGDLLAESRRLKNVIVSFEDAESWDKSVYGKEFSFRVRGKKTHVLGGLRVEYPGDYASQISRDGKHLVLMTREEAARMENPTLPAGEGATTISVEEFPLSGKTLVEWVRSTPESNFALSAGEYEPKTMNGVSGIVYEWSGLYEAITYAVDGGDGNVVLFTVTYLTRGDDIVRDFDLILSSFRKI